MKTMTEQEWLGYAADPRAMLEFLQRIGAANEHKFRLFAVACCRLLLGKVWVHPWFARAVHVAERYADGEVSASELENAYGYPKMGDWRVQLEAEPVQYQLARSQEWNSTAMHACWNAAEVEGGFAMADAAALNAAWAATQPGTVMPDDGGISAARLVAEQTIQCHLLRDIFVPFLPVDSPSSWLARDQSTFRKIANTIYDDRSFDRLPILADALEEAGCTDAAILGHSRQGGEDVRGCWVVDLLLGKQ